MKAKNAIYTCNEELFDNWTEKSAYLLGYLEADGCIKIDGPAIRVYFQVSSKDLDYLEQLKTTTGWTGSIGKSKNFANGKEYEKARFTVSSRAWKCAPLLRSLRKRCLPPVPDALLHHYIRGYFDGDGSIYFEQKVQQYKVNFVFSNRNLARELRELLLSKGIKCSNVHRKTNSQHCWYFLISYKQVPKLGSYLYNNAHISLNRKRALFNKEGERSNESMAPLERDL